MQHGQPHLANSELGSTQCEQVGTSGGSGETIQRRVDSGHVPVVGVARSASVLGDSAFDSVALYEKVARYGGRLLAIPRKGAGKGHVKQSEERLTSLFLWRRVGRVMRRQRVHIERVLGNQSSYGGGLGPLPPWVRTLERARRWVGAKLILHHARLAVKRTVA